MLGGTSRPPSVEEEPAQEENCADAFFTVAVSQPVSERLNFFSPGAGATQCVCEITHKYSVQSHVKIVTVLIDFLVKETRQVLLETMPWKVIVPVSGSAATAEPAANTLAIAIAKPYF